MENSMEGPQKTKNRATIWSNNPTTGYISKENENTYLKRYMYTNVHRGTIYNSQGMEAAWESINRQVDKNAVYV